MIETYKLPPKTDMQQFAKEKFGPRAYVPVSRFDHPDAETIGYIEAPDGTYGVILLDPDR